MITIMIGLLVLKKTLPDSTTFDSLVVTSGVLGEYAIVSFAVNIIFY